MRSIFNKFINVMLILLLVILILNRYYVIEFNVTLRNIFIYLSLIIILLTSIKEALEGSGFNKFLGIIIILLAIVGGIVPDPDEIVDALKEKLIKKWILIK